MNERPSKRKKKRSILTEHFKNCDAFAIYLTAEKKKTKIYACHCIQNDIGSVMAASQKHRDCAKSVESASHNLCKIDWMWNSRKWGENRLN